MLAGHETVAKTVSKPDTFIPWEDNLCNRSGVDICVVGAREAARDPAQATGRGYRSIRSDKGTGKRGFHARRYR